MATQKEKDNTTFVLLGIGALLLLSMKKKAAPAEQIPVTVQPQPGAAARPAIMPEPSAIPVANEDGFIDLNRPAGYTPGTEPMMTAPVLTFPKPSVFPTKYPYSLKPLDSIYTDAPILER